MRTPSGPSPSIDKDVGTQLKKAEKDIEIATRTVDKLHMKIQQKTNEGHQNTVSSKKIVQVLGEKLSQAKQDVEDAEVSYLQLTEWITENDPGYFKDEQEVFRLEKKIEQMQEQYKKQSSELAVHKKKVEMQYKKLEKLYEKYKEDFNTLTLDAIQKKQKKTQQQERQKRQLAEEVKKARVKLEELEKQLAEKRGGFIRNDYYFYA